jgi:hypothetical protein
MTWDDSYFGVLGTALVSAGVVEFLAGVSGTGLTVGFVCVDGTSLVWRGVIVVSAGAFFLRAATNGLDARREQGVVVLGATMLWIVAGTDVLARVLGAISGGSDVWVAGPTEVLRSVAPPYSPSVVAAVPATAVLRYVTDDDDRDRSAEEVER